MVFPESLNNLGVIPGDSYRDPESRKIKNFWTPGSFLRLCSLSTL